ncbi:hypothetical protein RYH80_12075 [Halobaculum sp. MBLA0147]|uniref:hypothetical protein n=1 Tax=Halobaculum sp. MBLA0147 TaxID=3079934 RepID=UPI0035247949
MKASIKKEVDDGFGVLVTDNRGAEHKVGVGYDGGIDGHLCSEYADHPRDRTDEENELNEQTRKFARYYVHRQRGYDTLPRAERPEHLDTVRRAVADLSADTFRGLFSEFHQQLRSHHDDTVPRPRPLPAGVSAETVLYKLDVYLGADLRDDQLRETAERVAGEHGLDLEDGLETQSFDDVSADVLEEWTAFAESLGTRLELTPFELPADMRNGVVSGVHVAYPQAGELTTDRGSDPLDREPDATLELAPVDPGPIDEFQSFLDHHLKCQIRDAYVTLGLAPPEPFQVLGLGSFHAARLYHNFDVYPEFHSPDAQPTDLFG